MLPKLLNLTILLIATTFAAKAAICYYEPADGTLGDELTFYFDASQGTGGLKGYEGDVYAHVGVLTEESSTTSNWKHSSAWLDNDEKYKMTRSADNADLYTISFVPNDFYGLSDGESVTYFMFVFRSADGSREGKDTGSADIAVKYNKHEEGGGGGGETESEAAGAYLSHEYADGLLCVRHELKDIYLSAYAEGVIKVLAVPAGQTPDERASISVTAKPMNATVEDGESAVTLNAGKVSAEVSKQTGRISFYDSAGEKVLEEDAGITNGSTCAISFKPAGEAAFWGGGYNGFAENVDGVTLIMNNTQNYGWSGSVYPNNICIPFVASSAGYGLLFDDHYRGARITPSSANGTGYYSEAQNDVAYYFIGGDGTMASVMKGYAELTGFQELPPYWALGYISSRYGYKSQTEAEGVVETFKGDGFPIDAIVFDLYWQGTSEAGMGNLDWEAGNFPDPEQMMADFKAEGVHTICITEPFFTSACANYQTLSDLGYLADGNVPNMTWLLSDKVGLIDATNPEAMEWMRGFYKARTAEGVSGWWLDLGEPEQHGSASVHKGGSIEQVHNEFGNLWVGSVYEGLKADFPDMRHILLPRAGTSGMQRYSAFPWTGDITRSWSGLQSQVPALLNAGMSGLGYMGSDVGGFVSYGTDPRLYLRWVEFAVFSPVMRTHSTDQPEPYNACYSSVYEDVKSYVNLRYKFLPYSYTLCYENASSGQPLARPTGYYGEAGISSSSDSYLWGRDIFVAPVLSDAESRSITFPEGEWIDMNDYSLSYAGGSTVTYSAPLDLLPHFARRGSFITTFEQDAFENTSEIDNESWRVLYFMPAEGETASALVYDDDKASPSSLEDGQYSLIAFEGADEAGGHSISISETAGGWTAMAAAKNITFEIPGYGKLPYKAVREGASGQQDMQLCADSLTFASADDPAYYLAADGTLYLKTVYESLSSQTLSLLDKPTGIDDSAGAADDFRAYRNERSSLTVFEYELSAGAASASILIYDLSGTLIETLENLPATQGYNQVPYPGGALSQKGVLLALLRLELSDGTQSEKRCKVVIY